MALAATALAVPTSTVYSVDGDRLVTTGDAAAVTQEVYDPSNVLSRRARWTYDEAGELLTYETRPGR